MLPSQVALLLSGVLTPQSTSAQSTDRSVSGPFKPGPANSQEALQLISASGRTPNRTSALSFPFTSNGTSTDWTWRVNITTINVPNSGRLDDLPSPDADYSQGLQVVNTQWELTVPTEGGSFAAWLGERNMNLFVQTLVTSKPSNVTEPYSDEENGDCGPVLGDQCTRSIMMASDSTSGTVDFAGLEGCEATLNSDGGGGSDGTGFAITGSSNASSADPGNGTLFYRTSPTYTIAEDNLAQFNESVGALQVLLIKPEYGNSQGPRGQSDGPKLFCRIVDKEVVDSTAESGQESSAVSSMASMVLLCSFFVLALVL